MASNRETRESIVALDRQIRDNAGIAARSMESVDRWMLMGSVPVIAVAAWHEANAMATALRALGAQVDPGEVFAAVMGMRRWSLLKSVVEGGR